MHENHVCHRDLKPENFLFMTKAGGRFASLRTGWVHGARARANFERDGTLAAYDCSVFSTLNDTKVAGEG